MKLFFKSKRSAILLALFFCLFSIEAFASLPLTETIYTLPPGKIEFRLFEEFYQLNRYYLKENIEFGVGIMPDFSAWITLQFVHGDLKSGSIKNEVGDLFVKLWYYIGNFCHEVLHVGIFMEFRFPLGKNAYLDSQWRNVIFGNNELTIGSVFQFDIINAIFLHFNFNYTFQEGKNEDFWGGFYLNPIEKSTWVKLFGFNPAEKGTFLNKNRLKNDYFTLSLAIDTNQIYPFIPYIEFYTSFRPYRGKIQSSHMEIEAAGIDVFLISAGIRYFFIKKIFLGIYTIHNPLQNIQKDYVKGIYGLDFSVYF